MVSFASVPSTSYELRLSLLVINDDGWAHPQEGRPRPGLHLR